MDIVVVTPRQLAPTVGRLHARVTVSAAPILAVHDSPTSWESIYFGSLCFTAHLPALRPAFDALHEGVDMMFGGLRFHANRAGIISLPDSARPTVTESTSPPTTTAASLPPHVGSLGETESTFAPTFYVDCESHH